MNIFFFFFIPTRILKQTNSGPAMMHPKKSFLANESLEKSSDKIVGPRRSVILHFSFSFQKGFFFLKGLGSLRFFSGKRQQWRSRGCFFTVINKVKDILHNKFSVEAFQTKKIRGFLAVPADDANVCPAAALSHTRIHWCVVFRVYALSSPSSFLNDTFSHI